jgi:hypothetical protein
MLVCLVEPQVTIPRRYLDQAAKGAANWKMVFRRAILAESDGREKAVLAACEAVGKLDPVPDLIVFGLWTFTRKASRRVQSTLKRLSRGRVVVAEIARDDDRDAKRGDTRVWTDGEMANYRQELSIADEAVMMLKDGQEEPPHILANPASRVIGHGGWRGFLFLCGEVNLVQKGVIPEALKQVIKTCDLVINPAHTPCSIHEMTLKRDYLGKLAKSRMLVHVANRQIPSVARKHVLSRFSGKGEPYNSPLLISGRSTARIHPTGKTSPVHEKHALFRLHLVKVPPPKPSVTRARLKGKDTSET